MTNNSKVDPILYSNVANQNIRKEMKEFQVLRMYKQMSDDDSEWLWREYSANTKNLVLASKGGLV